LEELVIGEIGTEFDDAVVVVLFGGEVLEGDFGEIEHNVMVVAAIEEEEGFHEESSPAFE
jgi:hypothetical protein